MFNDKFTSAAHKAAKQIADNVIANIPELLSMAVEKRRKEACWFLVYRKARLRTCNPAMRPFWRWLVKKSDAACRANKATAYIADGLENV